MFFLEEVHEKYDKFSPVQKRIADFIMKNPEKVCFCSLKELAAYVGVTEVTILRFVKNVGSCSFVQMKQNMREHMQTRFLGWGTANTDSEGERTDAEQELLLKKFIANEIGILENTYRTISTNRIAKAVSILKKAKVVYVVGHELASQASSYLARRLLTIGIKAIDLGCVSHAIYIDHMNYLGPDDAVIILSIPGHFQFVVNTVHFLAKKKVPHIVITDSEEAPVAEKADAVLTFDNTDLFFYNSILGMFSVANMLTYCTAMENPKETNLLRTSLSETTEEIGGISPVMLK